MIRVFQRDQASCSNRATGFPTDAFSTAKEGAELSWSETITLWWLEMWNTVPNLSRCSRFIIYESISLILALGDPLSKASRSGTNQVRIFKAFQRLLLAEVKDAPSATWCERQWLHGVRRRCMATWKCRKGREMKRRIDFTDFKYNKIVTARNSRSVGCACTETNGSR